MRYIDADKIHEFVDAKVAEGKDGWAKGVPYEWAYALTVIDMQPTADVVPKSEAQRWRMNLEAVLEERSDDKAEIARDILSDLKRQIHDKAVHPHSAGVDAYISLKAFDAILQNYINSLK